jgi:hypothetical protein
MADNKASNDSSINLDLTDVNDPEELAQAIEKFYKADSVVKTQLAYNWERTQLMLDGKQWLTYEGNQTTGGMWRPLKVSQENEYIPRPVTNLLYDAYQTLKGYLLKSKPRITVRPNSSTNKDKSAARLATIVAESMAERLHDDANDEYAASVLVSYGTVFKKSYWDMSYASQIEVPMTQSVPVTDPMTGQPTGAMEDVPVMDEYGFQQKEKLPLGDVNTTVIEPFRVAMDPLASDLHNASWIMEYGIQSLDWITTVYSGLDPQGQPMQGYTGLADTVKPESQLNNSMRRFTQLKTSSGVKNGSFNTDSGGTGTIEAMNNNTAVVKEYYQKPNQTRPQGRTVVVANGVLLYDGDSLSEGDELGDWHPYSECRWEIVPGRFWGKGALDEGCEIQKRINSIDASIILTRKTMAIPQWLIPLGIGVEPGSITGRPGQQHYYRPDGSGQRPEKIPGNGVDASVFNERNQAVEDLKTITGAIDILKGDRPPGVTAASALSMLYEVGTGKLFPVLGRWKRFKENDQKKQLRLVSKHYREPRPEFIRMLQMKNTDTSTEEIHNFVGEDLYDNCNVIIEAGSNIPKLQAAEQALLLEVANTGALSLNIPANRSEFLTRLGILGFDNDVGPDTKRAEWENDIMDAIQQNPDQKPVVLLADNNQIHIDTHQLRMKQPSFMSLPSDVQQAYLQHVEEHNNAIQQQQQMETMKAAAAQSAGAPPPPPAAPQQGAQTPGKKPPQSGNGVTGKMKDALFSDALVPGLSKPTR